MIKKITITLLAFSLASCFSFGEKAKATLAAFLLATSSLEKPMVSS
jgi:hypothetical protein